MITLEKVKLIREKKNDNPDQLRLFGDNDDKKNKKNKNKRNRSAQRQGSTTKKSVGQTQLDIDFKDNLKKAGASGDVSDKAGPEIRKRVETIRKTRADKLGTPDPFDADYDKKVKKVSSQTSQAFKAPTRKDIFKGNVPKGYTAPKGDFGKGLKPGEFKALQMDKRSFPVTPAAEYDPIKRPKGVKLPQSFKNFSKKLTNLKVDADSEKFLAKIDKKRAATQSPYKAPKPIKSVSRPPFTRFDNREPFSDDDLGQRTGKTGDKVVNKQQKPSTKVSNTVSKTFKKNKSIISQNPDLTRRRQLGAAGMDSNFQGGGAGGSTAGGTGSSTKGSTILGPDGKPLPKISKSERVRKIFPTRKGLKKAEYFIRKDERRKENIKFRKAGQNFANEAQRRATDEKNKAFQAGSKFGTDETLKASQRSTAAKNKEIEKLKRELKKAQKGAGTGTGTGSFGTGAGATNVEKLKNLTQKVVNLGKKGGAFSKRRFAKNLVKKGVPAAAKGLAKFAINKPLLAGGLAAAGYFGADYLRSRKQQDFFNKNTTPTKAISGADGKPIRFYGNPDKGQSSIRDLPSGFKSGKFKVKDSKGKNIDVMKDYKNSPMAKDFRKVNKKITQNQKITSKQRDFFNQTKKNMKAYGVYKPPTT